MVKTMGDPLNPPKEEDVELNLGAVSNVVVEPVLTNYKTGNYKFNSRGNVNGWDEVRTFKIEARNTRNMDVKIEIKRNFRTQYWDIEKSGDFDKYEKEDFNTVKFTLLLKPQSKKAFEYVLRTYHEQRERDWREGNQ